MKNKYELADVVLRFGKQLMEQENLSPQQTKALYNIVRCRTPSLGWYQEACTFCGQVRYSYNSCGDRHCPKCQATKQALWIEQLIQTTLAVKHYHIIFTVPHCLNKICLWDSSIYYKLLFRTVWTTLRSFGYTHYGVETGAVAVLHTWGQKLCLHPHIHCLVPAAGYTLDGHWKNIGKTGRFIYPVHQLSKDFREKFLSVLKQKLKKLKMLDTFDKYIQQAYKKPWVVFSEASMAGAEHVIQYLGQYTHRVAISNHRILKITNTHVTFIAKDYRENALPKPLTIEGVEFLRRFCLHILPKQFVKVRRFGVYNPTTKRHMELEFGNETVETFKAKKKETARETLKRLTGFDICLCPICKKGTMVVIKEMPRIRSPAGHLPTMLLSLLN